MKSNKQNPVELHMTFNIGHCNGSMSLTILANDFVLATFEQIDQTTLTINRTVTLPCKLTFITGNKNPLIDTQLDADGKIIQDKFIEITDIQLGRFPVNIYKCLQGQSYWGLSGSVSVNFDEPNFLLWHLKNNM